MWKNLQRISTQVWATHQCDLQGLFHLLQQWWVRGEGPQFRALKGHSINALKKQFPHSICINADLNLFSFSSLTTSHATVMVCCATAWKVSNSSDLLIGTCHENLLLNICSTHLLCEMKPLWALQNSTLDFSAQKWAFSGWFWEVLIETLCPVLLCGKGPF